MLRSVAIAALLCGYGHPSFDGYRPAGLDRALQAFYLEVNKATASGRLALARFDSGAAVRSVRNYVDSVEAELKPGN
jgi:hypothetical protein